MLWSENCFKNARVLDEMADRRERENDTRFAESFRILADGNRCMAYLALFTKIDSECGSPNSQ